ncbi:MAG: DUF3368 domain-containing protein [Candidatus Latescibacterota bacterium]|nr:MAG: DUF3368 domain-containing protein [Candidatus Latescibacterota bacterium]
MHPVWAYHFWIWTKKNGPRKFGTSGVWDDNSYIRYIPPAVREEAFGSNPLPEWIEERQLSQPLAPRIMAVSLGPGEREAIALALELKATRLLLDDLPARRLASSLGLEIIGTLGLLLWAKEQGLLPAVRPWVDTLLREGFYISERLLAEVLSTAGEA